MKIAFFASEANPFCKTGGLADVSSSLSAALVKMGHEVIFGLPYYKNLRLGNKKPRFVARYTVHLSWREQEATIYSVEEKGVTYYLIHNDYYFSRDAIYGYPDDGERFAFFTLAIKDLMKVISFKADIVHVHDWQVAMLPCLIREGSPLDSFYSKMKFILTIHNPAFKGMLERYSLGDLYNLPDYLFMNGQVRFENQVSTLKSGIVYADKITTVSPTHREELLTTQFGQGLEGVLELRRGDFSGILNGIDYEEWNPSKDRFIAKNFTRSTLKEAKKKNREDLLASFNLPSRSGPIYGIVSRLSWQKGIDILIESFRKMLRKDVSLIILGSGEYDLEQKCESLLREFPGKVGIYIGYNETLAHKIYAGCDYFLMPSLFEPCGISQMIAERYGTLPIVRYTGGLKDTVEGYNGKNLTVATGIGFNDYDVSGLDYALGLSLDLGRDNVDYFNCAKNAMAIDHTWKKSASLYEKLYLSLIR